MGDVAVIYKLMPEGLEVDLDVMRVSVEKIASEHGKVIIEERPVAFGLKALLVSIVMPDKTAKPDLLEEQLGAVEGVQSVNTESLTLI